MDFAIAPIPGRAETGRTWEVFALGEQCGVEVASRLASFAHRLHAEAFLSDLLAQMHAGRDQ